MLAGVDRVLLGRQPERVVSEGVEDMVAGHPQVPRVHVGADVAERVPYMQPGTARVGEHVERVELAAPRHLLEALSE